MDASSSTRWCPITMPAIPRPAWAAGDGARSISRPAGRVLPCHAAESIPGLEFWSVRDHAAGRYLARCARRSTPSAGPPGCASRARAVRAAEAGFRRLPLPGVPAHRRRPGHRPGLPPLARPRPGGRARCRSGKISPTPIGDELVASPDREWQKRLNRRRSRGNQRRMGNVAADRFANPGDLGQFVNGT